MRLLGIDPGLNITGYGIVSVENRQAPETKLKLVEAGIIRTPRGEIGSRLCRIHQAVFEIVREFHPQVVVIEKLYSHYNNPSTAILMGHARGVICLAAAQNNVPLVNIASTHSKKAVLGAGHGSKRQMQCMVQHQLSLKSLPEPADVADALALTIAYASMLKARQTIAGGLR
jgi:crossover junction endodeoxyribonuclease RuvC